MALDGILKHWSNGEPTIPDEGLTTLEYWQDGSPYTIHKAAAAGGLSIPVAMNYYRRRRVA